MQPTWPAYRITLLLYLGVLILPFSFYYTYTSIQDLASDTTIIRQLSKDSGEMLAFVQTSDEKTRKKMKMKIDQNLKQLIPWFRLNNNQEFYVGGKTLQQDFNKLLTDWNTLKNDPQVHTALTCWRTAKSLTFTVDKMLLLKQHKIENIFYINLILSTIFLILMIYLVRTYIKLQMNKLAIHDIDTKLFNKKYLLSEVQISRARSVRYRYPLSMLSISISDFGEESEIYDKKTKKHILKIFGGLITSLTRESDIACRYDENHFSILLPDTEEGNALILESRVREVLEKHDFMVTPEVKFRFSTIQFNYEETAEAFITRTKKLLN